MAVKTESESLQVLLIKIRHLMLHKATLYISLNHIIDNAQRQKFYLIE